MTTKERIDRSARLYAHYGIGGSESIATTRALWEEAFAIDPVGVDEATIAVTDHSAFVWDNLTARQVIALHTICTRIVLQAREV